MHKLLITREEIELAELYNFCDMFTLNTEEKGKSIFAMKWYLFAWKIYVYKIV